MTLLFSSDNGPGREGSSGALRGRKGTTFEGGQKVPFIATYVNGGIGKEGTLPASNVIKSTAMNIDLFPTILSYAGIDNLPSDRIIDGVNIRNLLEGTIPVDQPMHESLYYIAKGKVLAVQKPISDGEDISVFKYYEKVQSENTAFFDQVYKNYLFNLSIDPIEAYNISMAHPEIALSLKEDLLFFREQLKENQRGIIKDN
jgi:arylsulfatase A